jgi:hypothetical protein
MTSSSGCALTVSSIRPTTRVGTVGLGDVKQSRQRHCLRSPSHRVAAVAAGASPQVECSCTLRIAGAGFEPAASGVLKRPGDLPLIYPAKYFSSDRVTSDPAALIALAIFCWFSVRLLNFGFSAAGATATGSTPDEPATAAEVWADADCFAAASSVCSFAAYAIAAVRRHRAAGDLFQGERRVRAADLLDGGDAVAFRLQHIFLVAVVVFVRHNRGGGGDWRGFDNLRGGGSGRCRIGDAAAVATVRGWRGDLRVAGFAGAASFVTFAAASLVAEGFAAIHSPKLRHHVVNRRDAVNQIQFDRFARDPRLSGRDRQCIVATHRSAGGDGIDEDVVHFIDFALLIGQLRDR